MAADPVYLLALARALEAHGVYNGAKFLRAAAERELIAASEQHLPGSEEALAAELEGLAPALAREYGDRFSTAIMAAARAIRGSETLSIAEAPPLYTCRSCATIAMDEPPAACPRCGAHALTFREHLPIWFLEPMEPEVTLVCLEAGPGAVAMLLGGRGDEELTIRPRPGEWSARDVLHHLAGAEELLATRARRLLEEEEPELVARSTWSETPRSDEPRPEAAAELAAASQLLARYRELREATVERLASCTAADWRRRGHHPEWGPVTLGSQAAYFARHEASHLGQLSEAVASASRERQGEPEPSAGP
jgi:hypothetical protein